MRHKLTGILLLVTLGFAMPAFAKLDVKTTRIEGVEAWYVENDTVPVVDVIVTIEGAGASSDPEGKGGRANFAANMLTEGAGTYDSNGFAQALEERTISLGITAYSDRLMIHLHCLRSDAARAGELLALALTQPTLTEPDMVRVKAQTNAMFKQWEESPGYRAGRLLASEGFKGHPYANPIYGTAPSVAGLGAADVRAYLAGLGRGNMQIAAAGDVDSGLLSDMLSPALRVLPAEDRLASAPNPVTLKRMGETLHEVSDLPQTVISFSAPGLPRNDKRFYTLYLLNYILGGDTFAGRLGDELRRKQGLVYGVSTRLESQRDTDLLTGNLATRNSTAETALTAVKAVIAEVREKGVTTEQCSDARSFVLGNFPLQLNRSSAIAQMLSTMQVNKLGKDYMDARVEYFNKVSCGDINTLAREVLAPERFLFAVVGGTNDSKAPPPPAANAAAAHTDVK